MSFYSSLATRVLKIITKRGMSMTLRRTIAGMYTPATGINTVGTSTDYPCKGLVLSYTSYERKGTTILDTDQKVMLAASDLTITPQNEDVLIISGNKTLIVSVDTLAPGGIPVLYTLQVRA